VFEDRRSGDDGSASEGAGQRRESHLDNRGCARLKIPREIGSSIGPSQPQQQEQEE
jgi:hypothetical protein